MTWTVSAKHICLALATVTARSGLPAVPRSAAAASDTGLKQPTGIATISAGNGPCPSAVLQSHQSGLGNRCR